MSSIRLFQATAVLLSLLPIASFASGTRETRAQSLHRSARARLATGKVEQRQFARRELEDAHSIAPDDGAISLALARLYLEGDMLLASRKLATRVAASDSTPEARFILGEGWRREWLIRGDDLARDRAIVELARGLARAPRDVQHARMLVPMLVEAEEREAALQVAQLAARTRPQDPDLRLVLAYASQNAGETAAAERLFRDAFPHLPAQVRARYEDLSPLLGRGLAERWADMTSDERTRLQERYWRGTDPDPTTGEHEARVEFWARVTHGWLLYGADDLGNLDMRAQLYIRYGPPGFVERNPIHVPTAALFGNWIVWTYPALGMRVWMESRNPLGHYGRPWSRYETGPVYAFPESLASHPEFQGMGGGLAVFRRLPPDVEPMPIQTAVVRFAGASGGRLVAQAEVEAPPTSRLRAHWVVFDSTSTEIAHEQGAVGVSACEPGAVRAAGFATELPPGSYRLAVRVDDEDGRRAIMMRDLRMPPDSPALALSDLAVVCGAPGASFVPGVGVRLEPSTGLVAQQGADLNAYFEIYHLSAETSGKRDYAYVCRVSPVDTDRRSWLARAVLPHPLPPPIEVSRAESTRDALRRQFFSVPVTALPAGRYRMDVRVTDANAGTSASTSAEFVRR